ncbi:putative membrane protein [Natranaerovirga pectinivora]|uniref:Putative membrane protein n=1 Tax=Natranaerovirga pectinivora TaxID=682400 RepID=A0A4R3MK77_9FIRM|nr:YibE/F family protein [Natranaerovirga pectinivora]TCT14221.1 putative membrane protein [Natranaerovirga pectinivora]
MKESQNINRVFVGLSIFIIILLILLPTGFPTNEYPNSDRVRVRILEVDDSLVYSAGGVILQGSQLCKVRILNGDFKGTETYARNTFMGKLDMDKVFEEGDTALAVIDFLDNEVTFVTIIDHYRLHLEIILFIVFVALLILFARWVGVKALISFVLTILMIWKVLIPSFLKGYHPIIIAMLVVFMLTIVIIALVAGINRKSLVAISGSFLGSVLTCILAISFGNAFNIHGAILPFSETLLYTGYAHLNLTDIFIAGIFLASAGALMDLAMDISTAIYEMVHNNPNITRKQAIQSGLVIGRAVIGTMTTTLLLAYSGGYVALLMVFMAQGTPMINILNLRYVSAEILHTIVGSIGLVTVAPFTAVLAGILFTQPAFLEKVKREMEERVSQEEKEVISQLS